MIPSFTDASPTQVLDRSKAGLLTARNGRRTPLSPELIRLAGRIARRDWGTSTPAQAILAMAASMSGWSMPWTEVQAPARQTGFRLDTHGTVKEFNILIRIFDGRADDRLASVADWLCQADQDEIQKAIRPVLSARFRLEMGRWSLPPDRELSGLRGFLMDAELFPVRSVQSQPKVRMDRTALEF